jgi:hypothetical protein
VDDFDGQILRDVSSVELTRDDLTEVIRNHNWMRLFLIRDVDNMSGFWVWIELRPGRRVASNDSKKASTSVASFKKANFPAR